MSCCLTYLTDALFSYVLTVFSVYIALHRVFACMTVRGMGFLMLESGIYGLAYALSQICRSFWQVVSYLMPTVMKSLKVDSSKPSDLQNLAIAEEDSKTCSSLLNTLVKYKVLVCDVNGTNAKGFKGFNDFVVLPSVVRLELHTLCFILYAVCFTTKSLCSYHG